MQSQNLLIFKNNDKAPQSKFLYFFLSEIGARMESRPSRIMEATNLLELQATFDRDSAAKTGSDHSARH